jgi:hypothetical protein
LSIKHFAGKCKPDVEWFKPGLPIKSSAMILGADDSMAS